MRVLIFAVALCSNAEPTVVKPGAFTAAGERWKLTKTAGAVPSSSYEQSYAQLDRLGADGAVVETFKFEERAWVRPDGAERTWVEVQLDAQGRLDVLQHQREPTGAEKVTRFRWNGTRFATP